MFSLLILSCVCSVGWVLTGFQPSLRSPRTRQEWIQMPPRPRRDRDPLEKCSRDQDQSQVQRHSQLQHLSFVTLIDKAASSTWACWHCFGYSGTLRVWELDVINRKIKPTDCQTGKLKRIVKCIEVSRAFQSVLQVFHPLARFSLADVLFDPTFNWCCPCWLHLTITQISEDDQFIYCGTTTGDIMKINMKTRLLASCGPVKAKYSLVGKYGRVIIDWCRI